MPTTTVLMAVHNAAPFLEDAVASVFNQTFVDFEFLVVDDGSTDNTGAMLAQLTDPRLRVISLVNNVGLVAALNVGIEEARGDLIARMDGDDVCEPRRLELQVEFMQAHPEVVLLGTGFVWIDAGGHVFERVRFPTEDSDLQPQLLNGNQFCHPSVMLRTDIVRRVGGYRSLAGGPAQDYDLWLRMAEQGKIANLAQMLVRYRMHENQTSISKLVKQRRAAHLYLTLARQRRSGAGEDIVAARQASEGHQPEVINALRADYQRWALRFAAIGQKRLAASMLLNAFRLDRTHPAAWLGLWHIIVAEWESSWLGTRLGWYAKRLTRRRVRPSRHG